MTEAKLKTFKKVLGVPRFKVVSNDRYESNYPDKIFRNSKEAFEYLLPLYNEEIEVRELFIILLLNRANKIIGVYELSKGGTAGTVVDIQLATFMAINNLAKSVILSHNHPSGNLSPSSHDRNITQEIKQAFSYFDINVMDHIILSKTNFYSFADEGIL